MQIIHIDTKPNIAFQDQQRDQLKKDDWIYKTEKVTRKENKDIKIQGQNWFFTIDGQKAVITDGVVCGKKADIDLGI